MRISIDIIEKNVPQATIQTAERATGGHADQDTDIRA
jgi:hypothetical protein